MISCSLPNAIIEPAKLTEPTTAEKRIETMILVSTWPGEADRVVVVGSATSAAAPPPKPLKSATICGIAVIFTRCAPIAPPIPPTSAPRMIHSR